MRSDECGGGPGFGRGRLGPKALLAMAMGGRGRFGHGPWWGGGDDWGGARRGGPRGRGRLFGSGELRLVLLSLIAESPRHGYELIKAIEELTGGAYAPSPGVVYPTLSLMADEGVAEEQADGASRKAFAASAAGRDELAERSEEVEALLGRLKGLGQSEPQASPAIGRAIANLMVALRSRAAAEGFDRDTAHAIADILDEAARKVERL